MKVRFHKKRIMEDKSEWEPIQVWTTRADRFMSIRNKVIFMVAFILIVYTLTL